jgi:acyl-CoA thioester hydrolase
MGIAYHSNYFVWFEVGRVEFMRQLGFDYRQIEQQGGCFMAVADARCRYKAPARYDDEIVVRTQVRNLRGPLVQFAYEIVRATDGALLAEGETTHLVTDAEFRRKTLPEQYAAPMRRAMTGSDN